MILAAIPTLIAALLVGWFIVSPKWKFPILFDIGLTCIVFGLLFVAESTSEGWLNPKSAILFAAGIVLMALSRLRQAKKRRHTSPRDLDPETWQHVHGRGKK